MRQHLSNFRRQVGRRGLFLAFLAILDVIYGYFVLNPPPGSPGQYYPLLPEDTWGILWLVTGTACALGIFTRRDRIPYTMGALMMTAWGLRYAYLWYLGIAYAWVSTAVWLAFAFTIVVIASWPEEITTLLPLQGERERKP